MQRLSTAAGRVGSAARRVTACLASDPTLCLQLAVWRVSLPWLKRLVPLRLLARAMWAPRAAGFDAGAPSGAERVTSLARILGSGGRLLVSPNCLERSLVLYRLLSKAGADPRLIVGVDRRETGAAGHAWVEVQGQRFFDRADGAYQEVMAFGSGGAVVRST